MDQAAAAVKSERLISLDVFRGLTIAGMILVNNPGSWGNMYAPLGHAPWHGWTPTDFIFPFFLFMVGVAMTFSFDKRLAKGVDRRHLMAHVVARASVLFLLGLILTGFPNFRLITPYILAILGIEFLLEGDTTSGEAKKGPGRKFFGWVCLAVALVWFAVDFKYFNGPTKRSSFSDFFPLAATTEGSPIRIPGVLQRIALCYIAAALIMLNTGVRGRLGWALILINGYWLIMRYIDPPAGYAIGNGVAGINVDAGDATTYRGALNDWIDVKLLGGHLYRARPDPEGLLSTLPAVATTLLGVLTGAYVQYKAHDKAVKAANMFIAGNLLLIVGACMDYFFPINKKIWTSSYVVFMAGWALVILSTCYYLIDIKGYRKWSLPFLVLGTNAILAFFGSGLMARLLGMIKLSEGEKPVTLRSWLGDQVAALELAPRNASLLWAVCFVTVWVILLTPLYRKKWFLRI